MGVYLPLPSEYQEVEYIQSSGTQYIDTGISVGTSANSEILEGKIQFNSNSSSQGQANGKNKTASIFFGTNGSNKFYGGRGSNWGVTSLTNDYAPHTFRISQSEFALYIDGTSYSLSSNTFGASATTNIYIGACSDGSNTGFWCKENIYRLKIWQGGTLVRDFIPCYRKSDSVIGLYDLVNNQFYTNSGTGTFSKGADVTAIPLKNAYIGEYEFKTKYQEVEYIQSTATNPGSTSSSGQCINTGFTHTPNTKVEIDYQYLVTTVQQRMFGSETTNSSYSTFVTYINGSGKRARATKDGEGNWQSTDVTADTNKHTFVLDKSTYKIYTNGSQIHSGSNAYTMTKNGQYPLTLFATRNTGFSSYIEHASARLYGCKIWNNGTLVRDFIPCYRKSDNVIGLYDLVNDQFYTNSGTGTFTKGPNVN